MSNVDTPRIFKPECLDWTTLVIGLAITGVLLRARYRPGIFTWWFVIPSLLVILAVCAYISIFSWKAWVYLYEDRLEVEFAFTKLTRERFGIVLSRRRTVFFRAVRSLHKMRGFGAFNFLGIIAVAPGGKVQGCSFPYLTLQEYPELEAELLRRIPPNCELFSIGFTGRRGPFK
jgi:hypothetical protein